MSYAQPAKHEYEDWGYLWRRVDDKQGKALIRATNRTKRAKHIRQRCEALSVDDVTAFVDGKPVLRIDYAEHGIFEPAECRDPGWAAIKIAKVLSHVRTA